MLEIYEGKMLYFTVFQAFAKQPPHLLLLVFPAHQDMTLSIQVFTRIKQDALRRLQEGQVGELIVYLNKILKLLAKAAQIFKKVR